jgi:hypothetical protein
MRIHSHVTLILIAALSALLPACGGSGSGPSPAAPGSITIDDWVGDWVLVWDCPTVSDSGENGLRITKTGPSTLQIQDGDPAFTTFPLVYTATVGPTGVTISGTFTDTDDGGTYTENFTWTMQTDKLSFAQQSDFSYSSGALNGVTGFCGGAGTKQP